MSIADHLPLSISLSRRSLWNWIYSITSFSIAACNSFLAPSCSNCAQGMVFVHLLLAPQENLSGADRTRANLKGAFSRADLSRTNLRRTNLSEVKLNETDLSETDLSEANLSKANLEGANLRGANLSGANLNRTELIGTDFSSANLTGSSIMELPLGT